MGASGKFYYYYHFLIIKFHLQLNYDDCVYGHYQHRDNGDWVSYISINFVHWHIDYTRDYHTR